MFARDKMAAPAWPSQDVEQVFAAHGAWQVIGAAMPAIERLCPPQPQFAYLILNPTSRGNDRQLDT